MIPDFSGKYLTCESSNDGDIATILNEGEIVYNENFKTDETHINVEIGKKQKIFNVNNKNGQILQDAFGLDTKQWIGKQFEIVHIDKKKFTVRPKK